MAHYGRKEDSMSEKLLTAKEVAARLRVSLPAVYQLFHTGKLDGCKVGKKSIRFTDDQVRAYIEKVSSNSNASER